MTRNTVRLKAVLTVCACAFALSACGLGGEAVYPDRRKGESTATYGDKPRETVFGTGGLLGTGKKNDDGGGQGIGVNVFLWRASLDTIGFMPLSSADPFGGVIITDWYSPPESPGERFKTSVFILDRSLRADGVKVSAFRQARDPSGSWVDVAVEPKMATELENAILNRARQLRAASDEK